MPSVPAADQFDVAAILAGAEGQLAELFRQSLPAEEARGAFAELFYRAWRHHCELHERLLHICEPLQPALAQLDPVAWAAAPQHPVWRLLAAVQQSGIGYQTELGRAGDKMLADLGAALATLEHGDWGAVATTVEQWWRQEQNRIGRLEQRLVDAERGQLRGRRAQQTAARLLNQTMAGKQLSREIAAYLQGEWFQELQWALLQYGADSPQWRRRAELTMRIVDSLQPPQDDEAQQRLYALIPEIGGELAALLDERAHDRGLLEQQLALIEAQHLALLRGQAPAAAPFNLIANDDPWSSATTTVSSSLLQRVAVLTPGSWFLLREVDAELRIKLVLKMDDSTQLLFVNRLGVKALQKSFEEFAYLLSVGAVTQLPAEELARNALRDVLQQLAQRGIAQQQERAEARRQADAEARLRIEAKAKASAEAKRLAEAQARAAEQALQRVRDDELMRRREWVEQQGGSEEQRLRAARQNAALLAVGSWVELRDEVGNAQRLKVAVKLPSSGKLILVDRDGIRSAEFERDVFAARLFDGSAQILNQGPKFEDTLAKVVDSMRRDRAPRE